MAWGYTGSVLRLLVVLIIVLMVALPAAGAAEVRGVSRSPTYTDVWADWQAEPGKKGGMVVSGYVHNGRSVAIDSVRLQVESLDAAGQVLAKGIEHVRPGMGPGGRSYFEIPLKVAGESYRVTILYVDFIWGDERRRWW